MKSERILITVKTYPTLSRKYGETVCTAGVREDGTWVRLYPVSFRRLDELDQYSLFGWVEARLKRNQSDPRPETFRPIDPASIHPIVNAVAHRDYTDNSSVQVMLFADRLEVMNSGRLPSPLTVEKLRVAHQSLPSNPLLAESMYLLRYIEKMGTGTVDMIRRCAEAGLPEPEFEAGLGFLAKIWRPSDSKKKHGSIRNTTRGNRDSARLATQVTEETTQRTARKPPENRPIHDKTARKQPETVGWQPRQDQKSDLSGETPPETAPIPDQILSLLSSKPSAGRREIAAALASTESTIRYHMDKLRAAGRIERVGPDKGGHWRVQDDSGASPQNDQS